VVSFTPQPLHAQGKSPWYPLDRSLGGTQSRSGRGGEEKNKCMQNFHYKIEEEILQWRPGSGWKNEFKINYREKTRTR